MFFSSLKRSQQTFASVTALGLVSGFVWNNQSSSSFESIKAHCDASITLKRDLFSWGAGTLGQLGLGTQKDSYTPSLMVAFRDSNEKPSLISCFGNKTMVLTEKGNIYKTGTGMTTADMNDTSPALINVEDDLDIVDISVGTNHAAFVANNGKIYTWGSGYYGQLGYKDLEAEKAVHLPKPIETVGSFKKVSCGHNFSAAVDTSGGVWTWGNGRDGCLGHGDKEKLAEPKSVSFFVQNKISIVDVQCGRDFSLFLSDKGEVYTCGMNHYGQLGNGNAERLTMTPARITSLKGEKVVKLAAGEFHSACITDEGKMYTFGLGTTGQGGHGDKNTLFYPKYVKALDGKKIVQVACGGGHTAAVSDEGELFCWGSGRNGQLGRADHIESIAAYRPLPQVVDALKSRKVVAVACGDDHTVALVE